MTQQAEQPPVETLPVIQEDRDAAANLGGFPHQDIIRNGNYDRHPYVQAFARHRIRAIVERASRGYCMTDTTQPPAETLASKYENMGVHERATAMADDCVGDPWELLGYFREKLRQSERDAEQARDAATRAVQRVAALTRRAGGNAIPVGGVETIATAVMRYVTPHLKHMIAFSTLCEAIEQAYTPKPPAGGDDNQFLPNRPGHCSECGYKSHAIGCSHDRAALAT